MMASSRMMAICTNGNRYSNLEIYKNDWVENIEQVCIQSAHISHLKNGEQLNLRI